MAQWHSHSNTDITARACQRRELACVRDGACPFRPVTPDGLRYLSSRQALEDTAEFIRNVTQVHGLQVGKWIVFGGSYAGWDLCDAGGCILAQPIWPLGCAPNIPN
jgi:hypothetical protein